jgi:hypothetical protein
MIWNIEIGSNSKETTHETFNDTGLLRKKAQASYKYGIWSTVMQSYSVVIAELELVRL